MPGWETTSVSVAIRYAIQDVEQRFREPQQIAKAVEPEVDEIPGQFYHLKGELVLILVGEPHFRNHMITQVVLHEGDGFVEAGSYSLFVAVRLLLNVVTERGWNQEYW